jgi:hypothetical protein
VGLAQAVASAIEGDPFIRSIVDGNPVVGCSELVETWARSSIGAQLGRGAKTLTLAGTKLCSTGIGESRSRAALGFNIEEVEGSLLGGASERRGRNGHQCWNTRTRPSENQTGSASQLKEINNYFLRAALA